MKQTKNMTKIFKALSNPHRLELYLQIKEQAELSIEKGEKEHTCFLTTLITNLNIGAPTISHHLKELVNSELVHTERQGKFLICKLNTEVLNDVKNIFESGSLNPIKES